MLSPPIALLSADQVDELEALLEPIAGDDPSGPSLRFDPIFTEIRLAREEDDPNLPMGVWERPRKRADWDLIAERCKLALARHSKDLQIAAWLTEAWMRRHGVEGLLRGLSLIERLLADFWDTVHPRLDDDGDAEMRVAPLAWMNASLASTLRIRIPLLPRAARLPDDLSLSDWERMTMRELAPSRPGATSATSDDSDMLTTRDEIAAYAAANMDREVEHRLRLVRACLSAVLSIAAITDGHLGVEAPDMSKLRDTLRSMERVLQQMAPADRGEALPQALAPSHTTQSDGAPQGLASLTSRESGHALLEAFTELNHAALAMTTCPLAQATEAVKRLEAARQKFQSLFMQGMR